MGYVVLLALLPRGFGSDVRVRTGPHYICHRLIEEVRKCCVGGLGVFHSIMEQRGDHLVFRPSTLAHDGRHTQEVGDMRDADPLRTWWRCTSTAYSRASSNLLLYATGSIPRSRFQVALHRVLLLPDPSVCQSPENSISRVASTCHSHTDDRPCNEIRTICRTWLPPTKAIITIPITLYGFGNGDDARRRGVPRDGVMGGSVGSTSATKPVAVDVPLGL